MSAPPYKDNGLGEVSQVSGQKSVREIPYPVDFSITDSATWPVVITPTQMSAIVQRTELAVKKQCQRGTFSPAPFQTKPYRWRKVDVVRVFDPKPIASWKKVH